MFVLIYSMLTYVIHTIPTPLLPNDTQSFFPWSAHVKNVCTIYSITVLSTRGTNLFASEKKEQKERLSPAATLLPSFMSRSKESVRSRASQHHLVSFQLKVKLCVWITFVLCAWFLMERNCDTWSLESALQNSPVQFRKDE